MLSQQTVFALGPTQLTTPCVFCGRISDRFRAIVAGPMAADSFEKLLPPVAVALPLFFFSWSFYTLHTNAQLRIANDTATPAAAAARRREPSSLNANNVVGEENFLESNPRGTDQRPAAVAAACAGLSREGVDHVR